MKKQGLFTKAEICLITVSFICGNSGISYAAPDRLRPQAVKVSSAVTESIISELAAKELNVNPQEYLDFQNRERTIYANAGKSVLEKQLSLIEEYISEREPSLYGPHPSQEGLRPFYERVAWARKHKPAKLEIASIYAFLDQKHGRQVKEAVSFGIVLKGNRKIILNAPVMGGISAGDAEPDTHGNIKSAIAFFNKNIKHRFAGLNISQPDEIDAQIKKIDDELKNGKNRPRFSYIGAELAIGISMMASIALAEALHVPVDIAINYRYNEYCVRAGLINAIKPISIPVNYSVVWEGGKHGVAKTLAELVKEGVVKDISRFPKDFDEPLAMIPPQEQQIIVFAPNWKEAYRIGVDLTQAYKSLLEKKGIKTRYGDESGLTTDQIRTKDGSLITLDLVLTILDEAVESLPPEDAKYVWYAEDLASSEFYLSEIDMYYIGPEAAGNADGLVNNAQYTQYKLSLIKKHPRFISVEDWADENMPEHWEDAKQIIPSMIQMGDDFNVSREDLIIQYTKMGLQNAHLQKPNQSTTEEEGIKAVAASHSLGNVVVTSHRGTRSAEEKYTAQAASGMGTFGAKWTLWGPGRGALISAMTEADELYNSGIMPEVFVPYQGTLVLDPNGPYKDAGWAKQVRQKAGIKENHAKAGVSDTKPLAVKKSVIKSGPSALLVSEGFIKDSFGALDALEDAAGRLSKDLTIAFYGPNSRKLRLLETGNNRNLINGDTAQEVIAYLNEKGIKGENIFLLKSSAEPYDPALAVKQQISLPQGAAAVVSVGLAVGRLFNADNNFLKEFLDEMQQAEVITLNDDSRNTLLARLDKAEFSLSDDMKLPPQKVKVIEQEGERQSNFYTKIGV